jgi:hypothetical protein
VDSTIAPYFFPSVLSRAIWREQGEGVGVTTKYTKSRKSRAVFVYFVYFVIFQNQIAADTPLTPSRSVAEELNWERRPPARPVERGCV